MYVFKNSSKTDKIHQYTQKPFIYYANIVNSSSSKSFQFLRDFSLWFQAQNAKRTG